MTTLLPLNEDARLGALQALEILDTPAEPAFDRITRLAKSIFDVPMAAISLVDKDRQWFKSHPGLDSTETPRAWSFCTHTILGDGVLVVPDAHADSRFCSSPLVCGGPHMRFYAGAPLRTSDGYHLGALCIMDTVARRELNATERATLTDLADMVVDECNSRRTEYALRAAKEESESANQAKGDFLSRVSHEVRTPMNSILGFAQLMEMDELTGLQRANVNRILKSAKHLLVILNEVLDISRIDSGKLAVELEPVKVGEAIREAAEFVQPLLLESGISLNIETSPVSSGAVLADPQKLVQVFLNLLSNAIKYNRPKGTIVVTQEVIGADQLRIKVTDTGDGISAENQRKLFQPFERLQADRTKIQGTGLGLALCKRMVELMSGSIGVESVVGSGTTFWVQFALLDPRPIEEPSPQVTVAVETKPAAGPTVLYIEDTLVSIHLIKGILKRATVHGTASVRMISAMQGTLGLEMARIHAPDLILLDLHLPDLSGIQVLTQLRADARTALIPVVVLTADALPGTQAQVAEAGAIACLSKPVDIAQFLETISPILENSTK